LKSKLLTIIWDYTFNGKKKKYVLSVIRFASVIDEHYGQIR
jgi:hypothetical protein